MSNPMSLSAATGLPARPKGKTHRGSRGGGKGASPHTVMRQHHNALNAAMGKGDHATAKKHALSLVKSLHAITGPSQPMAADEPELPGDTDDEAAESMSAAPPKAAAPAVPSLAPTGGDPKMAARSKLAQTLLKMQAK